ncbi:helix-turn-helix transcriptional regulator [Aerococcus sp. 1KP-2016]|uniref:helix-turn-helix domain-containing protein n=1 Tax=Aerococcus sp. 1KP-2016 TaxID=1981982 RepID=UPI001314AC67|nr:helix-turn-helix transcriptional regulator [Aerococcus sp. 1KP-2016]
MKQRFFREYAVYAGDNFIDLGTKRELLERLEIDQRQFTWMTRASRYVADGKRPWGTRVAFEIEDSGIECDLSIRLAELLRAHDMTKYHLHQLSGVSSSGLTKILNGEGSFVAEETVLKIAKGFDITIEELLEGGGNIEHKGTGTHPTGF